MKDDIFKRAVKLQKRLSEKISISTEIHLKPLDILGAIDVAYKYDRAVVSYVEFFNGYKKPVGKIVLLSRVKIPYVPTFLFLREGPLILKLINILTKKPKVLLINGHGLTHPRKMGLATYIGIITGIPTIGVARKPLYGEIKKSDLKDIKLIYVNGAPLGAVISPFKGRDIYVSIGNNISLKSAIEIVLANLHDKSLPTPLWYADRISKKVARNYLKIFN